MILSCNSCEKKFVVPDGAISVAGRLVQCSSCGNKWTQFPINQELEDKQKPSNIKPSSKKIKIPSKVIRKKRIKKTGPNLYSPEYLEKKHGLTINTNNTKPSSEKKNKNNKLAISFGFYNFFIVSVIFIITTLRLLYFMQDIIIDQIPVSEAYIGYLFESLKNIKEIIQNFIIRY